MVPERLRLERMHRDHLPRSDRLNEGDEVGDVDVPARMGRDEVPFPLGQLFLQLNPILPDQVALLITVQAAGAVGQLPP
jgi:hypothetical protein